MRNMRPGGEFERLPPVEDFLASQMPLEKKIVGLSVSNPVLIEAMYRRHLRSYS